jgi:hypothetical protein
MVMVIEIIEVIVVEAIVISVMSVCWSRKLGMGDLYGTNITLTPPMHRDHTSGSISFPDPVGVTICTQK